MIPKDSVQFLKELTCLFAFILIYLNVLVTRGKTSLVGSKFIKASFTCVGIFAGLLWWNLFQFHYPQRVHFSDMYHYYMGAKYFDELGYTQLYNCTVIATEENSFGVFSPTTSIRNLENNTYSQAAEVLSHPDVCKNNFSTERWEEFKHDVTYFHSRIGARWARVVLDHGFNASPAWLVLGRALASTISPTDHTLQKLVTIDDILLLCMWVVAFICFGLQGVAVAIVFWGTNTMGEYAWTGGSLLRHDWLALAVMGICLLKIKRNSIAALFLTASALLRVFPILLILAIILRWIARVAISKTVEFRKPQRNFIFGILLGLAIFIPLSFLSTARTSPWTEFFANTQKHLNTRAGNLIGLETVVTNMAVCKYGGKLSKSGDCEIDEQKGMSENEQVGILITRVVQIMTCLIFASLIIKLPNHTTAILSLGLLPFLANASCYYYESFLSFGFLSAGNPLVGCLLLGLSFISLLISSIMRSPNMIHLALTVFVLQFVLFTAYFTATRKGSEN